MSRWLTWLQRLLVLIGVVCLGYYGYATVSAAAFQRRAIEQFEAQRAAATATTPTPTPTPRAHVDVPRAAALDWARQSFERAQGRNA